MKFLSRLVLALSVSQSAFSAAKALPFFTSTDLSPYWESEPNRELKPATLREFVGVDQNNQKVELAKFSGQLTLVTFFFAQCPSVCPIMLSTLSKFQKENGGISTLAFSVKPEHDTPVVLKKYLNERSLHPTRWTLVTGTREEMYRVGREMFKADGSSGPVDEAFIHTKSVYLLDSMLRIRGIYDTSSSKEMKLLALDIKKLRNK